MMEEEEQNGVEMNESEMRHSDAAGEKTGLWRGRRKGRKIIQNSDERHCETMKECKRRSKYAMHWDALHCSKGHKGSTKDTRSVTRERQRGSIQVREKDMEKHEGKNAHTGEEKPKMLPKYVKGSERERERNGQDRHVSGMSRQGNDTDTQQTTTESDTFYLPSLLSSPYRSACHLV